METLELLLLYVECGILSTIWYLYLIKKTKIRKKFLWTDNLTVILLSCISILIIKIFLPQLLNHWHYVFCITYIFGFSFILTMIRFWRKPNRTLNTKRNEIVSPVDGKVLYIKQIDADNIPVSIKNGLEAKLTEIVETDIIKVPIWLIGVNMTPFDVHKNCAPVSGKVILNKHIKGKFLSLKNPEAILRNERNTLVLQTTEGELFGVVQTASRLVRRIDTYVSIGQEINQGHWFGMIRFGSQVDIIVPASYRINVKKNEQIFSISTVIASK